VTDGRTDGWTDKPRTLHSEDTDEKGVEHEKVFQAMEWTCVRFG